MLRCQFLCHVLKAIFFIKIALKLSYFCKKMQNFRALGAPPPDPCASGGWGLNPQTPISGSWGLCPQTPKRSPPLRISGYAPGSTSAQLQTIVKLLGGDAVKLLGDYILPSSPGFGTPGDTVYSKK